MPWNLPQQTSFENDLVVVKRLNFERDLEGLWEAVRIESNGTDLFEYMLGSGPFLARGDFESYLRARSQRSDIVPFVVVLKASSRLVGSYTLFDVSSGHGTCELGSVWFTRAVQGKGIHAAACLEILQYLFEDLHFRRVSWKCNKVNEPSNGAARALGFSFEGTFRNHFWDKGKNRDTNWYSLIQEEWGAAKPRILEKIRRDSGSS